MGPPTSPTGDGRSTALLLATLVVISGLSSASVVFSSGRRLEHHQPQHQQLKREYLEDTDNDFGNLYEENQIKKTSKRESKGTCTCTCETRPVNAAPPSTSGHASTSGVQNSAKDLPKVVPESASLIRTAARMESGQTRQSHQPVMPESKSSNTKVEQNKVAAVSRPTTSPVGQIVRIPPMQSGGINHVADNDETRQQLESSSDDQIQTQDKWDSILNSGQDSWGHGSRYPWKRLPDRICYRESCETDKDCCLRYNICDRSAHVCVDCWYGSSCTSERDCCYKYPYCQREWKIIDGQKFVSGGKCVSEI